MKNKKKKVLKYRGSKTHGCGSMKKRRGAGNRGGRGRSGSGKRADQKKPSYWKEQRQKGFTSKKNNSYSSINIKDLENSMSSMLKTGVVEKKGELYVVDLTTLGFAKLLASGKPSHKFDVKVANATKRAEEKIVNAGGKITFLNIESKTDANATVDTKE